MLRAYADCSNPVEAKVESQVNLDSVLLNPCLLLHIAGLQPPWPFLFLCPWTTACPLLPWGPACASLSVWNTCPSSTGNHPSRLSSRVTPQRRLHWTTHSVLNRFYTSCSYHLHSTHPSKHSLTFLSSYLAPSHKQESRVQGGRVLVFCFHVPITSLAYFC